MAATDQVRHDLQGNELTDSTTNDCLILLNSISSGSLDIVTHEESLSLPLCQAQNFLHNKIRFSCKKTKQNH